MIPFELKDIVCTMLRQSNFGQFKMLVARVSEFKTSVQRKRIKGRVREVKVKEHDEEPYDYLNWLLRYGFGFDLTDSRLNAGLLLTGDETVSRDQELNEIFTTRRPAHMPEGFLPPHGVYLAFHAVTTKLIAITGFVPDIREIGANLKLAESDPSWLGFFAGDYVPSNHRGRGAEFLLEGFRDREIQAYVDTTGKSATVYRLKANQPSDPNRFNPES